MFRLIAKALGSKEGNDDKEADKVATIRILLVVQSIITNIVIVLGVWRHW